MPCCLGLGCGISHNCQKNLRPPFQRHAEAVFRPLTAFLGSSATLQPPRDADHQPPETARDGRPALLTEDLFDQSS